MYVKSFNTPDIGTQKAAIIAADKDPLVKSIIIFSCDENTDKKTWDDTLRNAKTTIFCGASKIFYYETIMSQGHIMACLEEDFKIDIIKNISSSPGSIDAQVAGIELDHDTKSRYVLLDGLSTQIAYLIESLQ